MTTRRTIRIEVTDQSDELEDHFNGPREREHATLVWEFPLLGGESPADAVSLIRGWINDGAMAADLTFRGGS